MKKLLIISLVAAVFFLGLGFHSAEAYVSVRGYYRSNGTYVQPYIRSNPNALKYDNYGFTGGNPYNSSYYGSSRNYSSNWYTPSYYTDPNYYRGLNLYNSSRYYYGY